MASKMFCHLGKVLFARLSRGLHIRVYALCLLFACCFLKIVRRIAYHTGRYRHIDRDLGAVFKKF